VSGPSSSQAGGASTPHALLSRLPTSGSGPLRSCSSGAHDFRVTDMRRLVEGVPAFLLIAAPFLIGLRAINLLDSVYGTHRDLHPLLGSEALFWSIPVLSLLASLAAWNQVWRHGETVRRAPALVMGAALAGTGAWWVALFLWRIVMGLAASAPDTAGPSAQYQLRVGLLFGVPAAFASVICAAILSRRAPKGNQPWGPGLVALALTAFVQLTPVELPLARLDLSSALRRLHRGGEDPNLVRHVCAACSVVARWPAVLDGVVPDLEKLLREDPSRATEVWGALSCFSLKERPAAREALSAMATSSEVPAQVRAVAVEASGLDNEERLRTFLRDESPEVRRAVVELIKKKVQATETSRQGSDERGAARPGEPRLEAAAGVALQIARGDPDPVVRGPALLLLGRLGEGLAYAEAASLARVVDGPTCTRAFAPDPAFGSEDAGYDHVLEAVVSNSNCSEIAERARGFLGARAEATSRRHAVTARDQVCRGDASANEALAVVRRIARESLRAAQSLVANLHCPGYPQVLTEVAWAIDLPPQVRLAASFAAGAPPRDLVLLFLDDNDAGLRRHAIDSLMDGYRGVGPMNLRNERERLWGLGVLQDRGLKDPAEANRRALCIGLERSFVPHEAEVVRLKATIHDQCQTMGLLPAYAVSEARPGLDLVLLALDDNDAGSRRNAIDSLIDGYRGSGPMYLWNERERLWGLAVLQDRGLKDPAEANRRAVCMGLEHSLVPHEAEVVRLKATIHDQCQKMGLLQERPP
jgi:hypothetical protein